MVYLRYNFKLELETESQGDLETIRFQVLELKLYKIPVVSGEKVCKLGILE